MDRQSTRKRGEPTLRCGAHLDVRSERRRELCAADARSQVRRPAPARARAFAEEVLPRAPLEGDTIDETMRPFGLYAFGDRDRGRPPHMNPLRRRPLRQMQPREKCGGAEHRGREGEQDVLRRATNAPHPVDELGHDGHVVFFDAWRLSQLPSPPRPRSRVPLQTTRREDRAGIAP